MWCWRSNVVVIPPHATLLVVPSSVVAATILPPRCRQRQKVTTGHSLTANLESNSKQGKQQEISGSDVVWALQRAAASGSGDKKIMKKKKKRGRDSSSVMSRMEETCVDVPPLCINEHWGPKLDELENRLRQLSDTI